MYVTYTAGMATFGVQKSSIDKPSADEDRLAAAISLAVNENMSVSYGVSTVETPYEILMFSLIANDTAAANLSSSAVALSIDDF